MSGADVSLAEKFQRDFREHSLPTIVSTVVALRQLDDPGVISSLARLDSTTVDFVVQQHLYPGVDNFADLFVDVLQTVNANDGHTAAKRRRCDNGDSDVDNFAPSSMYMQQNQAWNSVADCHKHLQY